MIIKKGDEAKVPIIIAMKGHPGTGKTTIARALAASFKIPLLDKDDVRDSTFSLQQHLLSVDASSASASALLNDLSYEVIYRMASSQLQLGLGVVLDSPLSRRAHLDRLVQLASSAGARLLVVECRPLDERVWRERLERRGGGAAVGEGASWHKPATWDDLEALLERYGGCTEYDLGGVPVIVVDTSADLELDEIVSPVVRFIDSALTPLDLVGQINRVTRGGSDNVVACN